MEVYAMSNNELVLDIMNTIEEIEEDGNTIVEDNYWLGFLFVKVGSDVYNLYPYQRMLRSCYMLHSQILSL